MRSVRFVLMMFLVIALSKAQSQSVKTFSVIPLGIYGGIDESNLSSYMVGLKNSNSYICFDAGTLHAGIKKAVALKSLQGDAGNILKRQVKGYLISHPHLDHVSGLIINSPDDSAKNIYGLPFCLDVIADKYFSWKSWANFADAGEKPFLKKYHYVPLAVDSLTTLDNTGMQVKAFELSHGNPYKSTAFLTGNGNAYVLYLGDTGADTIEKANNLQLLWEQVAPLVKEGKLKGIFIEVSYPVSQPSTKLFGHLTPALLMIEMNKLAALAGKANMKKVSLIVTHIKPNGSNEATIRKEVVKLNTLGMPVIFPQQGKRFEL